MKPPVAPLAGLARGHGLDFGASDWTIQHARTCTLAGSRCAISVAHDFTACPAPLASIRESVLLSRFDVSPTSTNQPYRPRGRSDTSFQLAAYNSSRFRHWRYYFVDMIRRERC